MHDGMVNKATSGGILISWRLQTLAVQRVQVVTHEYRNVNQGKIEGRLCKNVVVGLKAQALPVIRDPEARRVVYTKMFLALACGAGRLCYFSPSSASERD